MFIFTVGWWHTVLYANIQGQFYTGNLASQCHIASADYHGVGGVNNNAYISV